MLAAKAAEEEASDKSGDKSAKSKASQIASHADDPIPFTQLLSKLDLGGGTENLFEITLSQVCGVGRVGVLLLGKSDFYRGFLG